MSSFELLYNFLDAYRLGYSFDFRELYSNEPEHETKSKPLNHPLTKFIMPKLIVNLTKYWTLISSMWSPGEVPDEFCVYLLDQDQYKIKNLII